MLENSKLSTSANNPAHQPIFDGLTCQPKGNAFTERPDQPEEVREAVTSMVT